MIDMHSVAVSDLVLKEWPNGCVVFDRGTGSTHAVDAIASFILMSERRGLSHPDIVLALRSAYPDADFERMYEDAVGRLSALGLIRMNVN